MAQLPGFWLDEKAVLGRILAPLSAGVAELARLRRSLIAARPLPVPVLVVGNIFVGGTGKTPVVAALAKRLDGLGHRPGILVRGYLGKASNWPRLVAADSDPQEVGDEAVLLARQSSCPVVAGPDRVAAAKALLAASDCDCLISDDGLQHYRLPRQAEIVVIDASRGLGNGRCFPAGPLREPPSRLDTVDLVLYNGGDSRQPAFELVPQVLRRVDERGSAESAAFRQTSVHAIAGIGHPQRFFATLRSLGLTLIEHQFSDHHRYRPADLDFGDDRPIVMTEKDAVKVAAFADAKHWYLPVSARFNARAEQALERILAELWEQQP